MGSKKTGTQTTTQTNTPWAGAIPGLNNVANQATNLFQSGAGSSYVPWSTVAPFSPLQEAGQTLTADRALSGSPLLTAGQNNLTDTLNGKYLDPSSNPWLSKTFDLAAGKVRNALDSEFNSNGEFGSSMHQGATGSALDNLATQIYGGNYGNERNIQASSTPQSVPLSQADYYDPAMLASVGGTQQNQAQSGINDATGRFNFYNMNPLQLLSSYAQTMMGLGGVGGTQKSQQPIYGNPVGSVLGDIGSIASVAAMFSSRDWKTDDGIVDDEATLRALAETPVHAYRYKPETGLDQSPRLGPMAEDFNASFKRPHRQVIEMPVLLGAVLSALRALEVRTRHLA